MMKRMIHLNLKLLPLFLVLTCLLWEPSAAVGQQTDVQARLESLYKWFRANTPAADGSNFAERRAKTELLDEYGMQISNLTWRQYRSAWAGDPGLAKELEESEPVLYYFRHAINHAAEEIRRTTVTRGVVIWKLYNMGYVVKTKDVCFALDLVQPGAHELAGLLDFTVVSHAHGDHYDIAFLDAMVASGKKVYTTFYEKGEIITDTKEFSVKGVNVRFTMNDQSGVPVIVSQIDCGPDADHFTLYHIADSRVLEALNPTRHIHLLILHISNAIDIFETVKRIQPDATVYDHVMELGHAVDKYRWSYDFTYNKIRDLPKASSYVLTWGERLEYGLDTP